MGARQGSPMKRRSFMVSSLALAALPMARRAGATAARPWRVGWLTAQRAPSLAPFVATFRSGLAELGYREGDTLKIEFRYGDDRVERVPDLAAELVRLPVDVIVAQGAAVSIVSRIGLPVPVVYVFSGDPVSAGFADSLTRPLHNMTGLTFMAAELNGKRLELLRQIVPHLTRVTIVANPEHPGAQLERGYSEEAARGLGLETEFYPAQSEEALAAALGEIAKRPPQALSLFADGFAIQFRKRIIDFAMSERAPVISGWPVFAESGALCTYGPKLSELLSTAGLLRRPRAEGRQAGRIADRATDDVPARVQPEDGSGARPHHSTAAAGERGHRDRVTRVGAAISRPRRGASRRT